MAEIDREKVINDLQDAVNDDWMWQHADYYAKAIENAIELLKEQEEKIKNRDESLEKAREEIKWLRGMLKEQEVVKPKIDAFGLPYCPKCKTLVYNTWEFCPHCGQELKWDD